MNGDTLHLRLAIAGLHEAERRTMATRRGSRAHRVAQRVEEAARRRVLQFATLAGRDEEQRRR